MAEPIVATYSIAACDDGASAGVCVAKCGVLGRVEHERAFEVELALERDLRHAAAGGSEPALSHSSTVSPGCTSSTCAGVSWRSFSGVPTRIGNVP